MKNYFKEIANEYTPNYIMGRINMAAFNDKRTTY